MEKTKSIAILCAGGPAPGINTVIATITKLFISDGFRVLGINYGYKTLFTSHVDFTELTYNIADRIFDKGGSYLKMSRHKPKDSEFTSTFFEQENVKLLVTIGGDDTASSANRLSNFLASKNIKIQNIHVPKTIDNDLPLPSKLPTFGYQTAKNEGVRLTKTVFEDARSTDTWFIISAMGREAGHLAMGIGNACHAPMIIIPEMFYNVPVTFDRIVRMAISSMIKRSIMGIGFGVVIISEGVFHTLSEDEIKNCGINFSYDEHGHPELGLLSKAHIFNELIGKKIKELNLKFKIRPVEIGYEIRCCSPIAFDLKYCTDLGEAVKDLFDRGESQCIALATFDGDFKPLYLKDLANEKGVITTRLVDINSRQFQATLKHLEFINKNDYDKAKKYITNPKDFDLTNILNINI